MVTNDRPKKERMQVPVSEEFASYVTELANCLKWSPSKMAAELLAEGLQSKGKLEKWGTRWMADAVNLARGKHIAEGQTSSVSPTYLQVFVDSDVYEAIKRMAVGLNNEKVRVAAMLMESAARDDGWVIEAFGTGPGQALLKFVKSLKSAGRKGRVAKGSL